MCRRDLEHRPVGEIATACGCSEKVPIRVLHDRLGISSSGTWVAATREAMDQIELAGRCQRPYDTAVVGSPGPDQAAVVPLNRRVGCPCAPCAIHQRTECA